MNSWWKLAIGIVVTCLIGLLGTVYSKDMKAIDNCTDKVGIHDQYIVELRTNQDVIKDRLDGFDRKLDKLDQLANASNNANEQILKKLDELNSR